MIDALTRPRLPGLPREARGHRYAGGLLGRGERERHEAATVVAIIGIAATAVSTYASYEQAQTQNAAARSQAKAVAQSNADVAAAADVNARTADMQARQARQAAGIQADEAQARNRRLLSQQRALFGGQGITTEGSPLLVMMTSAEEAAIEESRIRFGGDVQASGFEAEAGFQRFQADRLRQRRVSAFQSSPTLQAGTTLLAGASTIASRFPRSSTGLSSTGNKAV